jgi:divalent metal cation (Fe/Co/Zn/Cd) transporter
MDEHLHEDLIAEIRKLANEIPGIEDTEKCLVRKSGMIYFVDLHIEVSGDLSVRAGHALAHRLKDKIQQELPEVADVLVHVEPVD